MLNILLNINNRKNIVFFTVFLCIFFFLTFLVPFWFVNYLSLSAIGYFFNEYSIWSVVSVSIFSYFIISGIYYYKCKIDLYVIHFISYSIFFDFFRTKDFVDINHEMLIDFAFFNRPLSFNKTLMLRIMNDNQRTIIKRFNISFISASDVRKISKALDSVIAKNR